MPYLLCMGEKPWGNHGCGVFEECVLMSVSSVPDSGTNQPIVVMSS